MSMNKIKIIMKITLTIIRSEESLFLLNILIKFFQIIIFFSFDPEVISSPQSTLTVLHPLILDPTLYGISLLLEIVGIEINLLLSATLF